MPNDHDDNLAETISQADLLDQVLAEYLHAVEQLSTYVDRLEP